MLFCKFWWILGKHWGGPNCQFTCSERHWFPTSSSSCGILSILYCADRNTWSETVLPIGAPFGTLHNLQCNSNEPLLVSVKINVLMQQPVILIYSGDLSHFGNIPFLLDNHSWLLLWVYLCTAESLHVLLSLLYKDHLSSVCPRQVISQFKCSFQQHYFCQETDLTNHTVATVVEPVRVERNTRVITFQRLTKSIVYCICSKAKRTSFLTSVFMAQRALWHM